MWLVAVFPSKLINYIFSVGFLLADLLSHPDKLFPIVSCLMASCKHLMLISEGTHTHQHFQETHGCVWLCMTHTQTRSWKQVDRQFYTNQRIAQIHLELLSPFSEFSLKPNYLRLVWFSLDSVLVIRRRLLASKQGYKKNADYNMSWMCHLEVWLFLLYLCDCRHHFLFHLLTGKLTGTWIRQSACLMSTCCWDVRICSAATSGYP